MEYLLSQHHIDRLNAFNSAIREEEIPVKMVLRNDDTHGLIIGFYWAADTDNVEFLLWRFHQSIDEAIRILKAWKR